MIVGVSASIGGQAEHADEMRAWVGAHPEVRRLLNDLLTAILAAKPEDPVAFAATWVKSLDDRPAE